MDKILEHDIFFSVIRHVSLYLNIKDISRFSRTNKRTNSFLKLPLYWKNKIEHDYNVEINETGLDWQNIYFNMGYAYICGIYEYLSDGPVNHEIYQEPRKTTDIKSFLAIPIYFDEEEFPHLARKNLKAELIKFPIQDVVIYGGLYIFIDICGYTWYLTEEFQMVKYLDFPVLKIITYKRFYGLGILDPRVCIIIDRNNNLLIKYSDPYDTKDIIRFDVKAKDACFHGLDEYIFIGMDNKSYIFGRKYKNVIYYRTAGIQGSPAIDVPIELISFDGFVEKDDLVEKGDLLFTKPRLFMNLEIKKIKYFEVGSRRTIFALDNKGKLSIGLNLELKIGFHVNNMYTYTRIKEIDVKDFSASCHHVVLTNKEDEVFVYGSGLFGEVSRLGILDPVETLVKLDGIKAKAIYAGDISTKIIDTENNIIILGYERSEFPEKDFTARQTSIPTKIEINPEYGVPIGFSSCGKLIYGKR